MVEMFGVSGEGVQVLLEWLMLFPQELGENAKIPVTVRLYIFHCGGVLTSKFPSL
jgi:hypothetical protein